MNDSAFWNAQDRAKELSQELSHLKEMVVLWEGLQKEVQELPALLQLAQEDAEFAQEVEERVKELAKEVRAQEVTLFLSGPYDTHNALVTIYAGAGGTESQDWVEMLLRMYQRYAEGKKGWQFKVLAVTAGQEAGLKNVTFRLIAPFAYGMLKGEHGVHRLVRVSPFSSQGLRHTSFAMVEVMPEIDRPDEIDLDPTDLRVDTYRSSGPGGQYVNKTESAVRITHVPTGIAAASQSERSQGANKEQAMKMLVSRLAHLLEERHKERLDDLRGQSMAAEWGSQIRSYVLHPYKMVKDHRTDHETSQAEAVLEGALDEFIEANIRQPFT